MKRYTLLLAMLLATPAWANSFTMRGAAAVPFVGSAAITTVTGPQDSLGAVTNRPVLQLVTDAFTRAGASWAAVVPLDATGPNVTLTMRYAETGTASGSVCYQLCVIATKTGQDPSSAGLGMTCNNVVVEAVATNAMKSVISSSLLLKDITGANCSGTACNGSELQVALTRLNTGALGCTGDQVDAQLNVYSVTVSY